MKVFIPPFLLSRAMGRVASMVQAFSPRSIQFVNREEDADLIILHVIGYPETEEAVQRIRARGQQYALLQYCVRSTQRPNTRSWRALWKDAMVVWSYYNLYDLMEDDERGSAAHNLFAFYHAPLGVDSRQFFHSFPSERPFLAMSSGYVAESECIHEVAAACKKVGGKHLHLGPDLGFDPKVTTWCLNVSDDELADMYRSSKFITGLRRVEGFELPAAEGLLCGARPILFDRPHYKDWFGEWAEYIPECSQCPVEAAVANVLAQPFGPIQDDTKRWATARFNWETLVEGFWRYVMVSV